MSLIAIQAPSITEERGWLSSPAAFIATGAAIAIVAKVFFTAYLPLALGLAAWSLGSGAILFLYKYAEGTRFERGVHKIHAIMMEINTIPIKIALFPLTFFSKTLAPAGPLNGRPILLINGYLSFASMWHFHKNRLADAGLGPIYTINVGSCQSIDTYAKQIQRKAKEIQKETGRNDLAIIGHSKGGLVGSHFATRYADEIGTRVTDLVTIGSPLAGTPSAQIGLGSDAKEMLPDAPFHKELRDRIEKNRATRFYHIGSEADSIVPHTSALIGREINRQMILKDTGHVALLFSSRVSDQICRWLKLHFEDILKFTSR